MKHFTLIICTLVLLFSCKEKQQKINHPIDYFLASKSDNIKKVLDSISKHEVQFRYTEINKKNGLYIAKNYDFNTNPKNYFYPASSVKLPVAILTLEKIFESDNLTKDTEFFIEGDSIKTTFAKEIIKIFAVSDNDAYNRLFEFLGQDYINKKLKEKGIENVRIAHRLATEDADNVTTKPLVIYLNDSTTTNSKAIINSPILPLNLNKIKKGIGYIDEENILQKEAFDFSLNNFYSIEAQQQVLQRVIYPESFTKEQQFNLYLDDIAFLKNAMSNTPKDAGYTSDSYYDSYVKFFMFGNTKDPIPNNIKIYNKVGYAYGTLTDCAFIEDTENDISFMLTATILVNKNGVFNDNNYEYETVGIPFLAELGREFYNYNLQKKQN
ncbi:MAG: serine hydrolase [Cellulophaga sp.]|uniref:serine hydrolase n=1 Tax=Cellulophaga sp. TaxID=1972202 RepID=UPI003264B5EF